MPKQRPTKPARPNPSLKGERGLKLKIKTVLDGILFNLSIAFLIVASVALLFIEYMYPPGPQREQFNSLSSFITIIFAIELSLRFYVAPNKKIFFYGYWLDILAVLPIFRFFRVFRIFRIFRLFTLYRSLLAAMRTAGWISVRAADQVERYLAIISATVMIILSGTLCLLIVESNSSDVVITSDGLMEKFWTAVYLFTSGEIAFPLPSSDLGRAVGSIISIAGVVVFALLVSIMSASMVTFLKTRMDRKDLTIRDLRDHVVICGWDNVGVLLLEELEAVSEIWRRGVVIVSLKEIDFSKDTHIKDRRRLFHINEDFTQIETLEKAGVKHAKTAIVISEQSASGKDQDRDARTVLAALTIEKLNHDIHTCAELLNPQNSSHLKLAGVEEIISRNQLTAGLLASSAVNEGVTYVISDVLTHLEGSYITKLDVPSELISSEFHELVTLFKTKYDALVVGLEVNGNQVLNPPSVSTIPENAKATVILKKDSEICSIRD